MNNDQVKHETIQAVPSPPPTQWVRCQEYETAGKEGFNTPERYAILLVQEGEITLSFRDHSDKTIERKSLVVTDQQQILHLSWSAGTTILEFTPPEKIFHFFGCCSRAFQVRCSSVVPVKPELQQWIEELMAERLLPTEELTDIRRRYFCVRLMNILVNYPKLEVGELLIAFQACSMTGEKKCKGEMCK